MAALESVRWVASTADKKLCTACKRGDLDGARRALEDGADPNCHLTMALGETIPIFLCAAKGHVEIAKLLLKHGADPSITLGFDGSTPLHHACCAGQLQMISFLLKVGHVDPNQATKLRRTPLMESASIGSVQMVELLVEFDANLNANDKEGRTPLSYAVDNINRRDARWYATARRLVELGADVNASGSFANGVTILHCACAAGDVEFVKILVEEKQAYMRVMDEVGKTPYDYAMAMDQTEVMAYLQQRMDSEGGCPCTIM